MRDSQSSEWCEQLQGVTVDNKYRLENFVGAGRVGYVYRATHVEFPESVYAVKLTFGDPRPGWEEELRKVMKLALIDGVVHFHGLGTAGPKKDGTSRVCQYTVWDYIEPGENLKGYLNRVGSIPLSFLIAVVERILHVLHSCDAVGVARHGDLHAGNILIGAPSEAKLDDALQPRAPIYVSDFGYGATDGHKSPKDDYDGLLTIVNQMVARVDYATATPTHRQMLKALQQDFGKLLREPPGPERQRPIRLLRTLAEMKAAAQAGERGRHRAATSLDSLGGVGERPSVGQFQVSEMIGDRWDWWRRLFVASVPARSKILALDIPTVVTGPRGCGKTMLFRRLSERLVVECGEVTSTREAFVAFYVNANDYADAFARFPDAPAVDDEKRLICYANLCFLADVLAVQSARAGKLGEPATDAFLELVHQILIPPTFGSLVVGEDRLERYRAVLEQVKWTFSAPIGPETFPGFSDLAQHRWLPRFVQQLRAVCPWLGDRHIILFVDDFSMPRVTASMQRVLNRLLLQRSPEFLAKVATEAWSTFLPEDSSGKNLQDGDDYQLVDMGEESLFLSDGERLAFLDQIFVRRLALDPRVPTEGRSLVGLLGRSGISKTEFARRLRASLSEMSVEERLPVSGRSSRRGASRARVNYFGEDIFADLWSGDTRTMIQLVTDVIEAGEFGGTPVHLRVPVDSAAQDKALRNRGGEWLHSHTRNEPTDPQRFKAGIAEMKQSNPDYRLAGEYGDHLKAIVEAFVAAASALLAGPTYVIREGNTPREVPRMAFRLEIIDEFRISGLAQELFRDLIRYGLFMRDNRGKSVRGAFVPRLYLRRLLLPYCTLATSKRDSVALTAVEFERLLLWPDEFKSAFTGRRVVHRDQLRMPFLADDSVPDPAYDDIGDSVDSQ